MKKSDVTCYVGNGEVKVSPREPFDDLVCEFLEEVSREILKDEVLKTYPDVVAFAFWIRRANLQKQKENYQRGITTGISLGRGFVFHIAPSNVPVNFAFSFVFGLLAGNSNIVRVSSKNFTQVTLLCEKLQQVISQEKYQELAQCNGIIGYERDKEITDYYSKLCDVRVIWGGDAAIEEIRTSKLKPHSKEIVFSDRYSFGIIAPEGILSMTEKERLKLAHQFYNDTYLMDQNACSTPHMIVWKTSLETSPDQIQQAQKLFWGSVFQVAQKYDLADSKVSDKFTHLCLYAVNTEIKSKVHRYGNLLYVVDLEKVPEQISNLRGRYGMFYQCSISTLDELAPTITQKVQTVAVEGVNKQEILEFMIKNHLTGIDRIVPFGSALDIGLIWDGYHLISEMSRQIL